MKYLFREEEYNSIDDEDFDEIFYNNGPGVIRAE